MEMLYGSGETKKICSLSANDTIGDIVGICHLTVGELSDIFCEDCQQGLKAHSKCRQKRS